MNRKLFSVAVAVLIVLAAPLAARIASATPFR